jgi:hypothetical protein
MILAIIVLYLLNKMSPTYHEIAMRSIHNESINLTHTITIGTIFYAMCFYTNLFVYFSYIYIYMLCSRRALKITYMFFFIIQLFSRSYWMY